MSTEYESYGSSSTNELAWLDQVESNFESLRDPKMDRVIDLARAASEKMQIIPHSLLERNEITHELDVEWSDWYGEPVYVRGKVIYQHEGDDGIKEDREAILWDTRVITNGYFAGVTHKNVAEDKSLSKLLFHMTVPVDALPDTFEGEKYIPVLAELDDITIESNIASTERALPWLMVTYPDFIQEIDRRLSGTMSVCDSIVALADIQLDAYIDINNELARNCVEVYLQSLIDLDTKAPYGLTLNGEILRYNDIVKRQVVDTVTNMKTLGTLSDIKLYKHTKNTEYQKGWYMSLAVETCPSDHAQVSTEFIVPFASISEMMSMREFFYKR